MKFYTTLSILSLLLLSAAIDVIAQEHPWPYGEASSVVHPYAGQVEPRVGNWFRTDEEKLRLDIGTSINLLKVHKHEPYYSGDFGFPAPKRYYKLDFGVDFFTWTQLRSAGRFKFPVEAVDYYFGVYGAYQPLEDAVIPLDVRFRLAHISAHLVDGNPGLVANPDTAITYSREFVDLLAGRYIYNSKSSCGWYVGGTWLFSTIPSDISRITPYAGVEYSKTFWEDFPLTLRLGYEFRLNTELETIGENQVRAGLKFASLYKSGVVLEALYYAGRSQFGQFFDRREKHFSIGFLVEH